MTVETSNKSTIVLVDDEQPILTELEILLCRDYEVHAFLDPLDVEGFIDSNRVDLIVCDEMMPEIRGSELLSRIHERHPDICKIVLSGQAEKHDIVKAINEGHIYSFLFKPVNRQQLLNTIEKGLENRRMKLLVEEQNRQLKDLNENLEQMVEERTAELFKAHKRLEQLDANKMSFLIYLSHEINSSLDRIKQLAEVLITYFGIAGSEPTVSPRSLSVKDTVDSILVEKEGLIEEHGITVENMVAADITVEADVRYWRFLVSTLINNGLVFCNEGGTVTIDAGISGTKTRFMVRDTGRGFSLEDGELLFKPFVMPPEKRNPEGFGLNLVQSRIIVEAHGGSLTAESPGPGQGATFTMEI